MDIEVRVTKNKTSNILKMSNEQTKKENVVFLTEIFAACRRKKALHDIQVIRSKLIPRATSPQTKQINGKPAVLLVKTIFVFQGSR